MNLLFFVPYYLPGTKQGGPIRSVHGLAKTLVAQGHSVTVLTTNLDAGTEMNVPQDEPVMRDGVCIYYFALKAPKRLYYCPALLARARSLMPKMDAVHINGVFLWPGPQLAKAARRENVPVFMSPRGMLLPELVQNKSRLVKKLWIATQERRALAKSARILTTVQAEASGLSDLNLDLAPIEIVPNGVESPPEIRPAEIALAWGAVPPGQRILFLGRLVWNKGVDLAIAATAAQEHAYLLIAGNDEAGLQAALEPQLTRADGSRCGTFLGHIDGQRKWALLAGADILLIPSLRENFGNVVAEAMSVGTAVLATEGVGAATYLRQVDPDLVVPRTKEAITAELTRLLDDPVRRSVVGEKSKRLVAAQLNWDAIGTKMAQIYEKARA